MATVNITLSAELRTAVVFRATLLDFTNGTGKGLKEWQDADFNLLSLKNTLTSRFYKVDIFASSTDIAGVEVVVPEAHAEYVHDMLESFGYKNIATEVNTVAMVDPYCNSSEWFFYDTFCEW